MKPKQFSLKGPGLKKAVQDAVKNGNDIETVFDWDSSGTILRVGYREFKKGQPREKRGKIIWFKPGDIEVIYKNHLVSRPVETVELEVEYTSPKNEIKEERESLIILQAEKTKKIRFRNIFRMTKNTIKSFVVQLEVLISKENESEKWNAVIRFDCAHNYAHLDLIKINGDKLPKIPIQSTTLKEAIENAVEEMKKNYKKWFLELGYGSNYSTFFDELNLEDELETAKKYLLYLIEKPEVIQDISSRFLHIKDSLDHMEYI
jgi:hypothetical protein